ncbi:hypothetical protein E4U58_006106 [Claviceps cyperi]|nr:hypothetical protein E4U58_006106 [Claviceps cyperi]
MQIKTALTAVLLMVSGATAIATDACEYNYERLELFTVGEMLTRSGSSCKFRGGPSSNSPVLEGKCESIGGYLSCIAQ